VARAVVVLGHGRAGRISVRCLRLVAEAELVAARGTDLVVFSGWSEAEQMRDAWLGPDVELVVEPTARSTAENASRTLPLLLERGVTDVVVVCAPPHLVRTALFFRTLYRPRGIHVRLHMARLRPTPPAIAWEIVALPLVPVQLRIARAELDRRLT
jgi:uncharacterized SAM-binding protein YcdF (DUF218 family)